MIVRSAIHDVASVRCSAPDSKTLVLSGALTFATAAQALRDGTQQLAARSKLDLAGVTRADSAGLACVLALLAQASRGGRRLTVLNLPEGLRALAAVCDASALICGHS